MNYFERLLENLATYFISKNDMMPSLFFGQNNPTYSTFPQDNPINKITSIIVFHQLISFLFSPKKIKRIKNKKKELLLTNASSKGRG